METPLLMSRFPWLKMMMTQTATILFLSSFDPVFLGFFQILLRASPFLIFHVESSSSTRTHRSRRILHESDDEYTYFCLIPFFLTFRPTCPFTISSSSMWFWSLWQQQPNWTHEALLFACVLWLFSFSHFRPTWQGRHSCGVRWGCRMRVCLCVDDDDDGRC